MLLSGQACGVSEFKEEKKKGGGGGGGGGGERRMCWNPCVEIFDMHERFVYVMMSVWPFVAKT